MSSTSPTPWPEVRRTALTAATTTAAVGAVSAASTLGGLSYLARRLLTPDKDRPDDAVVHEITDTTVTIEHETAFIPGRYGLWSAGRAAHLRFGEVVDRDGAYAVRELLGVDVGAPAPGAARWNSFYYWDSPQVCLGLPTHEVVVPSDIGDLPTWVVPGRRGVAAERRRWAVMVHGRGGSREECVRAVPPLHDLGITCLIPMYRNDIGAPASPDGRYSLGLSEWRDAEAAVRHALDSGAREIVMVGWSMGGATVLQMLDRSSLAGVVGAVVLDGPVIDWGDVIRHQARLNRVPVPLSTLMSQMIGQRWARPFVGVHEPIDVASTNWEDRADELRHRTLLIHSIDDDSVPIAPSVALARRRPDLVRFEPWDAAPHTKEWNVDPDRYERVIREFLSETGGVGDG